MAYDTPTLVLLQCSHCTCCCVQRVSLSDRDAKSSSSSSRADHHQPVLAGKHILWLLSAFLFVSMVATAEASTIRQIGQIGEAALCPFEAKQDKDESRVPATITQLTCKFSKAMIANSDMDEPESAGVTCEQIGGTCKQIHTTLQVSYHKSMIPNRPERSVRGRFKRSLRHQKMNVNSACVCVLSNGKPATPISPNYEVRK